MSKRGEEKRGKSDRLEWRRAGEEMENEDKEKWRRKVL